MCPVSENLKRHIEAYDIRARFEIIPNVVDTTIFYPSKNNENELQNRKKLLTVALLTPIKGIIYLLNAVKKLRSKRNDFELHIVGDGPQRVEYEVAAKNLDLENIVYFHGLKSKEEVANFMRSSDIFVLPSLCENLPCVLIEAMASGLPVVATNVGGIPELVDSETGILVPPQDPNSLAEAIDNVLDNVERFKKDRIAHKARTNFSFEAVAQRFNKLYMSLFNPKKQSFFDPYIRLPGIQVVNGRHDFIVNRCSNKTVLHLGCTDSGLTLERFTSGELLHQKLAKVCRELWGIDTDSDGISFLQQYGFRNLIVGDVCYLHKIYDLREKIFDVIVASEIIEHLVNPGLFLDSVKDIMVPDYTELIVTVPNAYRVSTLSWLFKGVEYIHPDHKYWFSWHTITKLLSEMEFRIHEVYAYSFSPESIHIAMNELFDKNLLAERDKLKHVIPFFSDGFIIIAKSVNSKKVRT
ncbi:MAG: glycosyltransferase [Candidatus Jordarchaeaceae archaeon]